MKKILLPSLLVCSLFASEQNYIEIGGGFVKSKNNFSIESEEKISGLKDAKEETTGIGHIGLFYQYEIIKDFNLLTQINEEGFKLGSSLNTKVGKFSVGMKIHTSEEWEDPYLINENRKETDVYEIGGYTSYAFSVNEYYQSSIAYQYSTVSYDKERVLEDLEREGDRHLVVFKNSFKTEIFHKASKYITNIMYEKYSADGKASSYDKYSLEVGVSSQLRHNLSLSIIANVGQKKYDAFNVKVDETVDVDIYGIKGEFVWDEPFHYEHVYLSVRNGYQKENANADFYNKENTFGLVSIGYRF